MPSLTLTDVYIRAVKPPAEGRLEVYDTRCRGLMLRVTSAGVKTFSFRYRDPESGAVQRSTFGRYPALSLSAARERADKERGKVARGRSPVSERREAKREAASRLSFGDLAERYIEKYAKVHKRSWRNDRLYLNAHVLPKWRRLAAKSITRRDVIDLLDGIVDRGSPVSANRTHSIISRLFSWALESELLDANPAAGLKKRGSETPGDRVLADDELRMIWRALSGDSVTLNVADALRLLLLTGKRPVEVAGAKREELAALDKPSAAVWEIPGQRMKNGRPHVVPLTPLACSIIRQALKRQGDEPRDVVFPSRFDHNAPIARHSLSQALKRLIVDLKPVEGEEKVVARLQTVPPTPRDFRRTLATRLAELGISREDRRAVLGHEEGDVLEVHYDRYERLAEKRAALVAWENKVKDILGQLPSSKVVPLRPVRAG
jgi:integrase